jgi:hypothetical protein
VAHAKGRAPRTRASPTRRRQQPEHHAPARRRQQPRAALGQLVRRTRSRCGRHRLRSRFFAPASVKVLPRAPRGPRRSRNPRSRAQPQRERRAGDDLLACAHEAQDAMAKRLGGVPGRGAQVGVREAARSTVDVLGPRRGPRTKMPRQQARVSACAVQTYTETRSRSQRTRPPRSNPKPRRRLRKRESKREAEGGRL